MTSSALSEADVRSYVDDGYLVVPGLIADADLQRIKEDGLRFARGDYRVYGLDPVDASTTDDEALRSLVAVHFPASVSSVCTDMYVDPGIASVLAQVTAAHLAHWDGRVKALQSMLFFMPPGYGGQGWHQDERWIPTRDRSLVGAWVAIDDATADNGCLHVIPGSHRMGRLWPLRELADPEYHNAEECFGFDTDGEVAVELSAGDVLFFSGYLLHRSRRNRTDGFRRAFVGHYANGWSLVPWQTDLTDSWGAGLADCPNTVPVVGADPYPEMIRGEGVPCFVRRVGSRPQP